MTLLIGCSSAVHLHPITDYDFYVRTDEEHKDDVCFSEDYYKHTIGTIIAEK